MVVGFIKEGVEFQVNTSTASSQVSPCIAVLDNGKYVIVWQSNSQDGSGYGIYGQMYRENGTTYGSEFHISTATSNHQYRSQIIGLGDGGFLVTWDSLDQDGDGSGVYGQRFDEAGAIVGSEFRVSTETIGNQLLSAAASLSDGSFVVVWESDSQDGDLSGIYGQRYSDTGVAVGSEFLVNSVTADRQSTPEICGLTGGGFVVVFQDYTHDGDAYGVFARIYDNSGNPAAVEFVVNTSIALAQYQPTITALEGGGFVVSWYGHSDLSTDYGVYAKVFDASGGVVADEFHVNTYTDNSQTVPTLAALADGGFVIVWRSELQDGSEHGVYGQRYSPDAIAVGDEFLVSTTTAENQHYAEVTALNNGGFVVTWQGEDQDGDLLGIFAQQFAPQTFGTDAGETMTDDLRTNYLVGLGGADTIFGGSQGDTIYGQAGADTLHGEGANDTLYGDSGVDTMFGGNGDDVLWGGSDGDTMEGGKDADWLYGEAGADTMRGDDGADHLDGGGGDDILYGGKADDEIFGREGVDIISGGNGNDTIRGNDGADEIEGGDGADSIYGGAGDDILLGGAGADLIKGNRGNDDLRGGKGDDTLEGLLNQDRLNGQKGDDILTGGDAADTFVFELDGDRDTITDFTDDVDIIELDQALWIGVLVAADVISNFGGYNLAGDAELDFGGGDVLTFTGITDLADLTDDIVIV